jgi:protein disulfide-isomerase A6
LQIYLTISILHGFFYRSIMMELSVWLLALASVCQCVTSLYTPGDGVFDLTQHNFQDKVINSEDVWLVEFYAPW